MKQKHEKKYKINPINKNSISPFLLPSEEVITIHFPHIFLDLSLFSFRTHTHNHTHYFVFYLTKNGTKLAQKYILDIHPGCINTYKSAFLFKSYLTFHSVEATNFFCIHLQLFLFISETVTDFIHTNFNLYPLIRISPIPWSVSAGWKHMGVFKILIGLTKLSWGKGKLISVNSKGKQPWIFTGRTDAEALILWATWCEEPTHWKRPWCWERLREGEGGERGWDGWMASPTQ